MEIRRAPKLLAWMLTGVVVGLVLAFIIFLFIPADQRSTANILGLLLLSLGSLFGGLGVATSITLDLLFSRRVKLAMAKREMQ